MEKWLTIDDYMDTIILAIGAIGTWFGAYAALMAVNFAKKYFLTHHVEKLKIEEFIKFRSELYWEAEKLKGPIYEIQPQMIRYNEIKTLSDKQEQIYGKIDEEMFIPFSFLTDYQKLEITCHRIIRNSDQLNESVSKIKSILLFVDDIELQTVFKTIETKVLHWPSILRKQYDPEKYIVDLILSKTVWPDVRKNKPIEEWSLTSHESSILEALKHLPNKGFDATYTSTSIISTIDEFQKKVLNYLASKVQKE